NVRSLAGTPFILVNMNLELPRCHYVGAASAVRVSRSKDFTVTRRTDLRLTTINRYVFQQYTAEALKTSSNSGIQSAVAASIPSLRRANMTPFVMPYKPF